jgi:ATP-dependent 26S proteasome regulatory subunit
VNSNCITSKKLLSGFDSRGDVKVVMATNRIETLDPALIRPGRIDRKIEFPLPDEKTKRRIFNIHTSRMTLAPDVNLAELIMAKDDLSGADIKVKEIPWKYKFTCIYLFPHVNIFLLLVFVISLI